jgi:hypothetical protein
MVVAAAAASRAHAGAWSANGDASLAAEWDSNVRFATSNVLQDEFAMAQGGLDLRWNGNASYIDIKPRGDTVRYRQFHPYDRSEGFLTVSSRLGGERGTLDFNVDAALDTTLTSERGLTGYTDSNRRRHMLAVELAPTWQFTERATMFADLNASRVHYLDAQRTLLVDYDYESATLGAKRQLSLLSSLSLQASGGAIRVPGTGPSDKDFYSLSLDYQRKLGQLWSTELSYGPSLIRNPALHSDDRGAVWQANLARQGERFRLAFAASRGVSPSGLGTLVRRDRVGIDLSASLSERLSASASVAWSRIRNSSLAGNFDIARLNYLESTLSLNWKPAATWTISLGAQRYLQTYQGASGTAGKTQALLRCSWNGLEHVLH